MICSILCKDTTYTLNLRKLELTFFQKVLKFGGHFEDALFKKRSDFHILHTFFRPTMPVNELFPYRVIKSFYDIIHTYNDV